MAQIYVAYTVWTKRSHADALKNEMAFEHYKEASEFLTEITDKFKGLPEFCYAEFMTLAVIPHNTKQPEE